MTTDHDLGQFVTQTQQDLRRIQQDIVALSAHLGTLQSLFTASPSSCKRTAPIAPASNPHIHVAIANGHRLADSEMRALDEDAYDVILATINSTLRYGDTPETHSELRLSHTLGIGLYRITILAFMRERFGALVCSDNIDALLGEDNKVVTAQTFTKSISMLRHALGGKGGRNPLCAVCPGLGVLPKDQRPSLSVEPEMGIPVDQAGKNPEVTDRTRCGHGGVRGVRYRSWHDWTQSTMNFCPAPDGKQSLRCMFKDIGK